MKDINENETFYIVFRWMITELNLKGNELNVFAVIYSFSQDVNTFCGSVGYIANSINATKQSVHSSLKKLVESGLLEKTEKNVNGVKFCDYKTNACKFRQKFDTRSKNLMGVVKKFDGGSQKILHHNKEDNKEDIISPLIPPHVGETEKKIHHNPPENAITAQSDAKPYINTIHTLKTRINALYGQKDTVLWSGKEITALRTIAHRPDVLAELKAIETLYQTNYQYKRKAIYTLLDNWTVELQRANSNATESQNDKPFRLKLD